MTRYFSALLGTTAQELQASFYSPYLTATLRMLCQCREPRRTACWEAYEFYEERAMVYLQVVSTDAREMACDNHHTAIPRRGVAI